ncbi:MAG: choice-of-anchor B family protein [Bacteroidota bacterium]|nr:choice-of-anchor B family protein [Bacteroidota bacterium]
MNQIIYSILIFFSIQLFSQQSLNMDLVGNLPYSQGTNDIWGYADGSSEYALVGTVTGFSVVDVTNPSNPIELFFIEGSSSTWRDIKTWGKYAYVTTEAEDGLLIVDLSDLSGQTYVYTQEFFLTSHNIYIDENGYAYIFGADTGNGGAIILDLTIDPMNPTIAGIFDDYYLHDGMVRGDTLWGSAIYAGVFSVIDVSDKSNPSIMSSYPTSCQFTHNAWISDDNNYLFTTDETSGCYIGSYDVSDIYNIQEIDLVQEWTGDGAYGQQEEVIPHNTHVFGDYLVTSYYTSGVTIIDASDPFNLIEVAYYDTSPSSGGSFDGCWGAYPYLPSGLILATDQQEGLFVLHTPYGSYEGFGCTNQNASNFNPNATINDGSCIFLGCTDSTAENYNSFATEDDGSCEYYCDNFNVIPPNCQDMTITSGESAILNCENQQLIFSDSNGSILYEGISFETEPLLNNSTFFVSNSQVVETINSSTGEENHQGNGQNADYSGSIYNGGLIFDCYSDFVLNSVKVYTDYEGIRTIELRNQNNELLYDLLISIPESSTDGFVIDLGWLITPGTEYLLTTNTELNVDVFGDNNPLLKRTTGGLPNFPYVVSGVLEIKEGFYTNNDDNIGSSTDYYYYFYDWEVTNEVICESDPVEVIINVEPVYNIFENNKNHIFLKSIDLLGRKNPNSMFSINVYDDGTVSKNIILE